VTLLHLLLPLLLLMMLISISGANPVMLGGHDDLERTWLLRGRRVRP